VRWRVDGDGEAELRDYSRMSRKKAVQFPVGVTLFVNKAMSDKRPDINWPRVGLGLLL